ncbi:hypothetical protein JCM17846_18460 [Iodidimonas nitroreducens]|uniref:DUF2190 family protein n=1 Tax=Iodidimonas nitroreducens TaxID=1236968 RepID=A0A5A7N8S6_9PROT|nr:DUF2190 family protein [Iodidimonas nitroreducens]GAK33257.1 hypothetical protein AQ1_01144 [alpha proteobacterium Q-1]GER04164.1 hypothetical protein JCM17846_18460 [Iodidimonas nitroreducens]
MKNFVQHGATVTVTAPEDVLSGDGVLVGSLFGVSASDATAGAEVEVVTQGVFDITKSTSAFTQGQKVYWAAASKNVTGTASGNILIGVAVAAAASGDATARVRLNGSF